MSLSKSSIEMLIDMVENRLSDMVVTDREDAKEQMMLRRALQELAAASLSGDKSMQRKRVGRRPNAPMLPMARLRAAQPQLEDTLIY